MKRHNKLLWGFCFLVIASLIPSDGCMAGADTKSDGRWDYTLLSDKNRMTDSGSNLGDFSVEYERLIKYFLDTAQINNIVKNTILSSTNEYDKHDLDYLLNTILNEPIPKNQTIDYIPISRSHKQFWAIINRVNLLPTTKESYHNQDATEIQESIFLLRRFDELQFLYAYLYFAQHFFKVPEIYQSRFFFIENADEFFFRSNDNSVEINDAKELVGDFCAKWNLLPKALKYYLDVYNFNIQNNDWVKAESVRKKIADMLLNYGNNDEQFVRKAIAYYLPADGPTTGGGDTSNGRDPGYRLFFFERVLYKHYLMSNNVKIIKSQLYDHYSMNDNIHTGLETAQTGFVIASKQRLNNEELFRLLTLTANCFTNLSERKHQLAALFYFKNALLSSITQAEEYNYSNIILTLEKLAISYARLGDEVQFNKYIKYAIKLTKKRDDIYSEQMVLLQKAVGNIELKKFEKGIAVSRAVLSDTRVHSLLPNEQDRISEKTYLILQKLFEGMNIQDSSNYYYSKQMILKNRYSTVINDLEMVEQNNQLEQDVVIKEREVAQKTQQFKEAYLYLIVLFIIGILLVWALYKLTRKLAKTNIEYGKLKPEKNLLEAKIDRLQTISSIVERENKTLLVTNNNLKNEASDLKVQVDNFSFMFTYAVNEAKRGFIHSAISRVLIRCLSHNIGSHALSKFIDKNKIGQLDIENQYESRFPSFKEYTEINQEERKRKLQQELIANFNEYLKYRMDFLADIATTMEPYMESPMYFIREIIQGMDKNRLLLNRISGVDPSNKKYSFQLNVSGKIIRHYNDASDPLMSVPNDVLGTHAFYIILENVIRNMYKHGNPATDFKINIQVKDSLKDGSFYEIAVFDNLPKPKSYIDKIVRKRNETFNTTILENNMLRNINLGSIEMAVCAAYLRSLPVDSCDNEKFRIKDDNLSADDQTVIDPSGMLIYAYSQAIIDETGLEGYSLGYKFFIGKPKQVLVISEEEFTIKNETTKSLIENGILIVKPDAINEKFISNHQFIYLTQGIEDEFTSNYPSQLPKRVVSHSNAINLDSVNDFIDSLWIQYAKTTFDNITSMNFNYMGSEFKLAFNIEAGKERKYSVFIDDHQKRWLCRSCQNVTETCKNINLLAEKQRECLPLAGFDYYDMACSHSKIRKLIMQSFHNNITLQAEYTECILTNIIIIDERLQHNLVIDKKPYGENLLYYEYFDQQGIRIPGTDRANLNLESFGILSDDFRSNHETVANSIGAYIHDSLDSAKFCIVHLGILEKMLPSGTDKSEEVIEGVILKLFPEPEQRRKLIITSNRGGALNIPDDICYVPFSLVQHALETVFDKFVLIKILFNTRKCK